jgi:hypothetical protein
LMRLPNKSFDDENSWNFQPAPANDGPQWKYRPSKHIPGMNRNR